MQNNKQFENILYSGSSGLIEIQDCKRFVEN